MNGILRILARNWRQIESEAVRNSEDPEGCGGTGCDPNSSDGWCHGCSDDNCPSVLPSKS